MLRCDISMLLCDISMYVGLASSDTYMKLAKEQELELSYIYVYLFYLCCGVIYLCRVGVVRHVHEAGQGTGT